MSTTEERQETESLEIAERSKRSDGKSFASSTVSLLSTSVSISYSTKASMLRKFNQEDEKIKQKRTKICGGTLRLRVKKDTNKAKFRLST
jgi:hypothetical protein